MERTNYCGTLRKEDAGKKVVLLGWVSNKRNLGAIMFIDLRDTSGIVQLTAPEADKIPDVRNEYVVQAYGTVKVKDVPNKNIPTGEVEVVLDKLVVINKAETTPFIIADKTDALEDTRLQYRYLDIRRPILQKRLKLRAKAVHCIHEYLDENNFVEVETPMLGISSPEGAKEYLVPSRVHPGCFYALPQSPQLYKQLLMIGGMERYYQIARCFRDEDLRADRQPDFTQVDIEMSFMDQDQVLSMAEGLLAKIFKECVGYDVKLPLRRMAFWDAMDTYGSDKPDTRYDLHLVDVTKVMKETSFEGFKGVNYVKAIRIPQGTAYLSRKKQDEINLDAHKFDLKSYMTLKFENGAFTGSFAKFLDEKSSAELVALMGLENGDAMMFSSHNDRRKIDFGMGALRIKVAKDLNLVKEGTYDLLWVVDFPMFDPIDDKPGQYVAEHHPFTRPRDEDLPKLDNAPEEVLAYAYDIIINGYEAGGGTLRIYDHDIQWKIFKLLGLTDEDVNRKFGWFIDAFKYGAPPHGGLAFGLDRLAMILGGTDNIRDVIAFPKNLQASDPMSKAPGEVTQEQLDAVHVKVVD
ncbi:MAG: aspartate--tRNA ligase [Bacilli bacterium]|nr:aspartate--tRNA ligase [Bacilli bacterium]